MLFEVIFVVSLRVFYKFFEANRRFSIDSDSDVQSPLITNIQTVLYKRDEYLRSQFYRLWRRVVLCMVMDVSVAHVCYIFGVGTSLLEMDV